MVQNGTNMNEVRKLYNDDGCVLKEAYRMTMNHGVQQEHLVLRKEGKNTETYVIILNVSGELIPLTVQRKEYVMRIVNT